MKSKLLLILSFFILSKLFAQDPTEWGVLPYDFSIGAYGAVYALSENSVLVAKTGHIYSSTGGGQLWDDYNTNIQEDVYDIAFQDQNTGYIVGDNGTLIKTNDGGLNWSQITLNTTQDLYSVAVTANGNVWAVGENGILVSSLDNGATWQENTTLATEVFNSVRFRNNNEGFITGNNGLLLHTQDMGQTWQTINVNSTGDFFSLKVDQNALYFLSGDGGYIDQNSDFHMSRFGENVYYTEDLQTWEAYNFMNDFGSTISDIELFNQQVYGFGKQELLCGGCCNIFIAAYDFSNDNITDSYWEDLTSSECNHINMVYSDFHIFSEDAAYVLVGDNVLKKGETGGFNFATENFQNPVIDIYPNPVRKGYFYVNSDNVNIKNLEVNLYDINGKLLKSFSNITENKPIPVQSLTTGVYFLKVKNNGLIAATKKMLIN